VKLDDGTEIASPVVVNVAGPHSAVVNGMAGALDDMTIETKPLRQEVVHVPAPAGFDFESLGTVVSDSDIGCYIRPETGNHILIGSEDPECDPREFVDPDDYVRDFTEQGTTQAHRYGQRVPTLGIPSSLRGVVDLYDASDDWIPIYDKSRVPGFYMAIGTRGTSSRTRRWREDDGRAHRLLRAGQRPRRRSPLVSPGAHRPRGERRLLLSQARDQPGEQLHGARMKPRFRRGVRRPAGLRDKAPLITGD